MQSLFNFYTFLGFLLFQLLLFIFNGLHLCIVHLSQLVPVCPVVVQTVEHGCDLFVEPGELLGKHKEQQMRFLFLSWALFREHLQRPNASRTAEIGCKCCSAGPQGQQAPCCVSAHQNISMG